MKKIILLLVFVNFLQVGYTQIIRGTVLDFSDHSTINFASIYINGTYIGTNSDKNGNFELDLSNHGSLPLTISALGYYSLTLTDFSDEKPMIVYLTPKLFELNEVVISAKSLSKEKMNNMKLFRNEFLGITDNAHKCIIVNENDIVFNTGSSKDTLKVLASKPLIINNNGLGYRITYYLDKFEYYKKSKSFLYKGSTVFNEDMTDKLIGKKYFEKKRTNAYLGSRNHFFSSLWANELKSNGFVVKNSSDEILTYEDIVTVRSGFKKYLSYKGRLSVFYLSKYPNSYIEVVQVPVFFDRTGYYDGSGVKIIGEMAKQRVGDLLPYEYRLK
jgi:hypothetical protein